MNAREVLNQIKNETVSVRTKIENIENSRISNQKKKATHKPIAERTGSGERIFCQAEGKSY